MLIRSSENKSRKEAMRRALTGDFAIAGLVTSFINPASKREKLFTITQAFREALLAGKGVDEIFGEN